MSSGGRLVWPRRAAALGIVMVVAAAGLAWGQSSAGSSPASIGAPASPDHVRRDLVLLDRAVRLRVARGEISAAQADAEFRRRAAEMAGAASATTAEAAILAEHRQEAGRFFAYVEEALRSVTQWPADRPAEEYELQAVGQLEQARERYAEALRQGDDPGDALRLAQRVLAWSRGAADTPRGGDVFAGGEARVAAALAAMPSRGPATTAGATAPATAPPATVANATDPARQPIPVVPDQMRPRGPAAASTPAPPGPPATPSPTSAAPATTAPMPDQPPDLIRPSTPTITVAPAAPGPGVALLLPPSVLSGGGVELGQALLAQGRFQEALAAFDLALRVEPVSTTALLGRGMALNALGDVPRAVQSYDAALRIQPTLPRVRTWLAELHIAAGQLAGARARLQEELRITPGSAWARSFEGTVLLLEGRASEAAPVMMDAIRLDPAVVGQRYENGGFMRGAGQHQRALIEFSSVLAMDPNVAGAYYGVASSLVQLGATAQAIQAYEAFLARDSSSEWAGQARAELARLRGQAAPLVPAPRGQAPGLDPAGHPPGIAVFCPPDTMAVLGGCLPTH